MSAPLPLEDVLSRVRTYAEYARVCESFNGKTDEVIFDSLFTLAINAGSGSGIASHMLVDLQPVCPIELPPLLAKIHSASIDPSNSSLPFYLVTQFGQRSILREAARVVPSQSVRSILYWITKPAINLCKDFEMLENILMDADDA